MDSFKYSIKEILLKGLSLILKLIKQLLLIAAITEKLLDLIVLTCLRGVVLTKLLSYLSRIEELIPNSSKKIALSLLKVKYSKQ